MKVEAIDAAHAIGTSDALVMCLWRSVTTREAIAELRSMATRYVTRTSPISFFTVVEANAEMPDSSVRSDLADMFKSLSASVACSALVFEGEGFRAATVRGITTGINLVAKQPFPHKVFATVDQAAVWVANQAGVTLAIDEIVRPFAMLRSSLDKQSGYPAPASRS